MSFKHEDLSKEERLWMIEGLELNSSVRAISIPFIKLRALFNAGVSLDNIRAEESLLKERIQNEEKVTR